MTHHIKEESIITPIIHTSATKICPHCGESRNCTQYVQDLWEANENDEIRYYLFHEPLQFLSTYWHNKEVVLLRGYDEERRMEYIEQFQIDTVRGIWGDGNGSWSKEYIELFENAEQWPRQCPYGHGEIDEDGSHGCPDNCLRLRTNG